MTTGFNVAFKVLKTLVLVISYPNLAPSILDKINESFLKRITIKYLSLCPLFKFFNQIQSIKIWFEI